MEDYCLAQALAGQTVPGYKLVEGRSVRTVTELEKTVGRKAFAKLSEGCVAKPPGKPTLVTEADKRPAWNPAAEDFAGLELKD